MKKIWPTNNSIESLNATNSKPITQEDYENLVKRVNESEEASNRAVSCVDDLIESQKNQVCTNNVTADSANLSNICSQHIESQTIDGQDITSETITSNSAFLRNVSVDEGIVADSATIGDIDSNNISTHNITSNDATIKSLSADNIETRDLKINGELDVDDLNIKNEEVENSHIVSLNANTAKIAELENDTAEIKEADVDTLIVSNAEVTTKLDTNYIIHERDPQEVNELGDIYILFPQFTNGFYMVEADNDTNKRLWSFELTNSIKNVQFRWSESEIGQLIDVKFKEDGAGISIVQVHAKTNEHITLYRQSITTSNTLPPTIYVEDQLPDIDPPKLEITHQTGTYIQDVIFTNKLHIDCLEMDALFMDCVGVYRELWLSCDFNISDEIIEPIPTCGENGQYVANTTTKGIVHPGWNTPSDLVDSTDTCLIPSCVVGAWDGIDYAGTYECDEQTKNYPIAHLNETTCAHGDLNVENDIIVGNNTKTKCLVSNAINDSNKESVLESGLTNTQFTFSCDYTCVGCASETGYFENVCGEPGYWWCWELKPEYSDCKFYSHPSTDIENNYGPIASYCAYITAGMWNYVACDADGNVLYTETRSFTGPTICSLDKTIDTADICNWSRVTNGDRYDELAVWNCDCTLEDKKPFVYNCETNSMSTTDELEIDDLTVDNLTVNCDAVIGGDLYVKGTTHTVEEETISTSSDMIVLRQNNSVGLASGEASGIVISKYNGTNNLALVTDCSGTLRVGEVSGDTETYADIYYKDGKWYSDQEQTTEITIAGELTAYDSKEIVNGATHYTNAVFTEFKYEDLSPVLGRDETDNMTDNALLIWNAATWEANTITVPTQSGVSLKYKMPYCCICGYECHNILSTVQVASGQVVNFCQNTNDPTYGLVLTGIPSDVKLVCTVCSGKFTGRADSDENKYAYFCSGRSIVTLCDTNDSVYCYWGFNEDNGFVQCNDYSYSSEYGITPGRLRNCWTLQKYCYPIYEEVKGSYYWEKSAGIYCFPSMACYEASEEDIPLDSLVIIDDVKNTIKAEIK